MKSFVVAASFAFAISIVSAVEAPPVGYAAPYHRYEAEAAKLSAGAVLKGPDLDQAKKESQASNMTYVELPAAGSALEWKIDHGGCDGVTLRFTMPDRPDGWKQDNRDAVVPQYRRENVFDGALELYVNGSRRSIVQYGKKSEKIPLSSYWMWQYTTGDQPADEPNGSYEAARFAFDEVHFVIDGAPLAKGDVLKLANPDGKIVFGVDFVEIEKVPSALPKPANALSVADYGTGRAAIDKCFAEAKAAKKDMYFPAGVWEYYEERDDNRWILSGATGMKITGAGMWHTNLHFPASKPFGGGVGGERNAENLEFGEMYLSSMLRSRCNQNAVYKGIMEAWGTNAKLHHLWIEHFECGMWFGDYQNPAKPTVGAVISECRLRNNLADGINLCQGTSDTVIENCSFRGNGDDGIAIWNNDACGAPDAKNDTIRRCTVENNWRAGGIAIFGGDGHRIEKNLVKDCYKGAGIRLNTDFPGYQFRNTKEICFDGNVIINCGTSWDCYGCAAQNRYSERGSVDIHGDIRNVHFKNTSIIASHRSAIQLRDPSQGFLKFTDTFVDGLGADGGTGSRYTHAGDVGRGRVIFRACSVKPVFDGLKIRHATKEDLLNELSSEADVVFVKPPQYLSR